MALGWGICLHQCATNCLSEILSDVKGPSWQTSEPAVLPVHPAWLERCAGQPSNPETDYQHEQFQSLPGGKEKVQPITVSVGVLEKLLCLSVLRLTGLNISTNWELHLFITLWLTAIFRLEYVWFCVLKRSINTEAFLKSWAIKDKYFLFYGFYLFSSPIYLFANTYLCFYFQFTLISLYFKLANTQKQSRLYSCVTSFSFLARWLWAFIWVGCWLIYLWLFLYVR